jgi:hypothetical protein
MMEMAKGLYVSLSAIGYQNIWISTFVNILEDTQTHYYNFFGKVQKSILAKLYVSRNIHDILKLFTRLNLEKKGIVKS